MRSRGSDALVAVALAAFVTIIVPMQSFIGNVSQYPYSCLRLLSELVVLFVAVSVGLFALLRVVGRFLDAYPQAFLVGLLVCAYLESGILSAGLPAINGGYVPELSSTDRSILDVSVWAVLTLGFVAGARWIRDYLKWIALGVTVMGVLSFLDVRTDRDCGQEAGIGAASASNGCRVNQMTVVANVRYSPVRNVLVFILDSLPSTSAGDAVRGNAELRAKFPGFTAYSRNIGMHECTKRGVPGLVTGRYYDPEEMTQAEYPLTMYGSNSFVIASCDAGFAVAFSPDLLGYGYINLPIEKRIARNDRRSRDALAILRRSREVPYLCLFDLVAFRLAPFPLKGPILYSRIRHAVGGRHSDDEFWGEASMYPILASAPVNSDPRQFLGVFHSWGVHPPWATDLHSAVTDKLTRLGELFDAYRARGLYDKSLIVVTCDHGLDCARPTDGYPPSAAAVLWVKPEGASGAFVTSDAKTSHSRIAALVRAASARTLTAPEVTALLRDENRLYRYERPDKSGFTDIRRDAHD